MENVVIAGGGLAAQRCAETLRGKGYDGRIRMVCAEPVRPYDRPPLSKEALASSVDPSLRPSSWYDDNDVELLLGVRATGVVGRYLETTAGALRFDRLLVATGAAPRRLPVGSPLRTVADAAELRSKLRPGARLAIVGAGFVGLEVAASARRLGVEVVLIDVMPLPLAGLLGPDVSRWLVGLHRDEGVQIILGEGVAAARRGALELVGGRRIACDHVVVGIGVEPGESWGAGRPDVFFAGDVTGTQHWDAAVRQAQAAGRAMLGLTPPPPALPSFWSDQYGLRLQYVGDAAVADSVTWDGAPGARDFTAVYRQGSEVVAALVCNRPRDLARFRRLLTIQEVSS
jgi:NADPH-dependent 2,4-dienoyl-CoA reductase/sulfur reductase-like enzyme